MSTNYQRVPYEEFALDSHMRVGGVKVIPAAMLQAFGPPDSFDEYKISGIFLFKAADTDTFFVVYDYKATILYDEDRYFTPDQFWAQTDHVRLEIGGGDHSDPRAFQIWLYDQVGPPPSPWWKRFLGKGSPPEI